MAEDEGGHLWHLSEGVYEPGTVLGPYEESSFFLRAKDIGGAEEGESLLEAVRPPEAPPRRSAVYATVMMDLIQAMLLTRPYNVYCVQIPDGTRRAGHLDQRYADMVTQYLQTGATMPSLTEYWQRLPNPHAPDRAQWEVLAEQIVVVGRVPEDRVPRDRTVLLATPPSPEELWCDRDYDK